MEYNVWAVPPVVLQGISCQADALKQRPSLYWDVFFESNASTILHLPGDEIRLRRAVREGYGVRLFRRDETLFFSLEGRAADQPLIPQTAGGRRNSQANHAPSRQVHTGFLSSGFPSSVSAQSSILHAARSTAFDLHPSVTKVTVDVEADDRKTVYLGPGGPMIVKREENARLRVSVEVKERDRFAEGYATAFFGVEETDTTATETAEKAVLQALNRLSVIQPVGEMPIIFGPGWGAVWLHEAVGHMLESDVYAQGPFAGCLGKRVGPEWLSVGSDLYLDEARGQPLFDDEGTQRTGQELIRNGQLIRLLADREGHIRHGYSLSGNGRRSTFSEVSRPRMYHLSVKPDAFTTESLMEKAVSGLYVTTAGSGMVNPGTGMFSCSVREGFLFRNGEPTARVAEVRVEAPLAGLLDRIKGIGVEAETRTASGLCTKAGQTVPVSLSQPPVLLSPVKVSPLF